jgi:signal transduction histidine kinase
LRMHTNAAAVALPKITDSFSSLVFFYHPQEKRVIFSNMPLSHFFGFDITLEEDLGTLLAEDKNVARSVNNEWHTCLHLKEKQTHQFLFHRKSGKDNGVIFHFHASGIRIDNGEASTNCILFSAEKSPVGEQAIWLRESERLRKQLERYKDEYAEFIDIAAHNLDAPLRKLSVLNDRLITRCVTEQSDDDIHSYVHRIRTCLDDMRSLIDSLATLSRVGSSTLKLDSCDLGSLMDHEWQEIKLHQHPPDANISLSSLPVVEGDPQQYRHLFRNLLENAVRFRKKNEPLRIHVTGQNASSKEKQSHGLEASTGYVKIEFRDNGIGFPQEFAEKIFRPFVRLHGKSEFPGNGIGLALCRSIVDNHRGIIYAESSENNGSRFILLLPQTIN